MALAGFAPTNYSSLTALSASVPTALPGGGGATLLVTNMGPSPIAVALGGNTVSVTSSNNGLVVNAGQSIALTVGSNGYIAAISLSGAPSQLNLAQGT
jgi:predicted naringenin-chalcone synthase